MSFSFKEKEYFVLFEEKYTIQNIEELDERDILKSKKCSERKLKTKPMASTNKTRLGADISDSLGADRKLVFLCQIG